MDEIMSANQADIVGFLDSDCVPISARAIPDAIEYVTRHETFLGTAQASNHIPPRTHIYASPAFLFVTRSVYERLNRPSFAETSRSDVGQEFTYRAEEAGIRYRAIYPTFYERYPVEGIWRLGNYGFFGIGTVFGDVAYHLYQGRKNLHTDLFVQRCDEILRGLFSTDGMISAIDFSH